MIGLTAAVGGFLTVLVARGGYRETQAQASV
jgi:hypothetical protein